MTTPEQNRWQPQQNDKIGLYCDKCNSVFYLNEKNANKLFRDDCPICEGGIYFICDNTDDGYYPAKE